MELFLKILQKIYQSLQLTAIVATGSMIAIALGL